MTHLQVDGCSTIGASPASVEFPRSGAGRVGGGVGVEADEIQGRRGEGAGEVGARKENGGDGVAQPN